MFVFMATTVYCTLSMRLSCTTEGHLQARVQEILRVQKMRFLGKAIGHFSRSAVYPEANLTFGKVITYDCRYSSISKLPHH